MKKFKNLQEYTTETERQCKIIQKSLSFPLDGGYDPIKMNSELFKCLSFRPFLLGMGDVYEN